MLKMDVYNINYRIKLKLYTFYLDKYTIMKNFIIFVFTLLYARKARMARAGTTVKISSFRCLMWF